MVFLGAGLGELHDQGRHRLTHTEEPGRAGSSVPSSPTDHRHHRGRPRQVGMGDVQPGAHRLHREVERTVQRAGRRRHHGLVVGGPQRDPQRSVGGLVVGVEAAEQVAARRELAARLGAGVGDRPRATPARSVPWCGEPSVTTRRASDPPSSSSTQSRATTPPAEKPTTSTDGAPAATALRAIRPSRTACRRRSPRPSPGAGTIRAVRPSWSSVAASTFSEEVLPPYPGTSSTVPSSSWATGCTGASRESSTPAAVPPMARRIATATASRNRRRAGARSASTGQSTRRTAARISGSAQARANASIRARISRPSSHCPIGSASRRSQDGRTA